VYIKCSTEFKNSCYDYTTKRLYVLEMEVNASQDASNEDSAIKLYRRLLYWREDNKAAGVQVATINDKLYVGFGKFWRQDSWKANRWAPGKKGSHIFLTADQYRALVSVIPKITDALELVSDLIKISENEFEDIIEPTTAVASAGSRNVVSGTEPACLSCESAPDAATAVIESTAATAVDACDGELREPAASQDEVKKTQDVTSTGSKRKRGRPSKASGQESATPKARQTKSRKTKSESPKSDGNADPAAAPAGVSGSANIVLEHGASSHHDENRVTTID
jgi:hypothetical protein